MINISGTINFSDIEAEFGKANDGTRNIGDYRRGVSLVPDVGDNLRITTAANGQRDWSDFRGASKQYTKTGVGRSVDTRAFPSLCGGSADGSWRTFAYLLGSGAYDFSARKYISTPAITVKIHGDETGEDDPYSSTKRAGVRNPGIRVVCEGTGTVHEIRGSGSNTDDDGGWTSVAVPAKTTYNITASGLFRVFLIADCYTTGAPVMGVQAPSFTMSWGNH